MLLEKVKCNLCNSGEEKILFSTNYGNIVKCRSCGLVYRNPRLSKEDELSHYAQSIEPHYEKVNISKEKLFRRQLEFIRFQFPIPNYPSPKLLDVGCSDGFFLQIAKGYGFDVYGVEVSKLAVSQARERLSHLLESAEIRLNRNRIFEGTVKEANFLDEYFDIITLWDVCGQFSDPFDELSEIKRILSPGGLVIIRTRNANFHVLVHRIFHSLAYHKISPTVFHLYSFSDKTMKKILEKAKFEKIEIRNSKMTIGDPYSGGKIFGRLGMKLIKYSLYSFCQIIYCLSGKKLVFAPSMLIYARK